MNTRQSNMRVSAQSCLVVVVAAVCSIARGDAASRELYQKKIADKSESERARLQRSFKEFRALPAEEQRKLRMLADELKEDDRNSGGLRAIMNQYHDWLGSLTPGQREDLRKQSDPNAREKRVRELLREQQEHAESIGPAVSARPPRGLSTDDLVKVLGVVETALIKKQLLTEEEKAELARKVGLARHMYVMERAYRRPGIPPRQQVGFTPAVALAMIAEITNPNQKKYLQSRERPEERLWNLFNLIRAGLMNEYESQKPDATTLEDFFVKLPFDKQDEIMRLTHDQQQQKLTQMYLEKKSEAEPDRYPRPPRAGFWEMPRPPGFRPQTPPGGEAARGTEADAAQKDKKDRKKSNKNPSKKGKDAGGTSDERDASEN